MGIYMDEKAYEALVGGVMRPGDPPKKPPKRHKYNAKPTEYKGRVYASKAEAARAKQLDVLKLGGKVAWWEPQVPFTVGEPGVDGRVWVDFLVCEVEADGSISIHAEDVKGVATAKFRRVVKQWRKRGPFPLHVIKKGKTEIIPSGSEA